MSLSATARVAGASLPTVSKWGKNGYTLLAGQGEAVDLCLRVAASEQGVDQEYVSEWIDARIVRTDELVSAVLNRDAKVAHYAQIASGDDIAAALAFYMAVAEMLEAQA